MWNNKASTCNINAIYQEQLAESFSQLSNLRQISSDIVSSNTEQYTVENVVTLSEICPLLDRFVWRGTYPARNSQ